jgi:hypothetical protein
MLRELEAALAGTHALLAALVEDDTRRESTTIPAPDAAQTAVPMPPPGDESPGDERLRPTPVAVDPDGRPMQLVLDDTDELPMVQSFQGIKELTPECKHLVDDFLNSWDIEYGGIKHKKLLQRLVRWIDAAPHGQVLVIKMQTLAEPFEPYPSYVSRELLTEQNSAVDE